MKRAHNAKFTNDEVRDIYEEYLSGLSTIKLAEKYKVSTTTIRDNFVRLGLPLRSNKINSRKYVVNHNYFANINTQQKAYWLGLIYADGYITKREGSDMFGISLMRDDEAILYQLRDDLESTYPVNRYTSDTMYGKTKYSRLLITSDKIVSDLQKHGVYFNKTNILRPPVLPHNLIRHFIRGYLDGDGSVYYTGGSVHVDFVGTKSMLDWIGGYLKENNLINNINKLSKRQPHQSVYRLRFGGNIIAYKILHHLYCGADRFLERKYKYYTKLQQYHIGRL